jgi:hypothetical protein
VGCCRVVSLLTFDIPQTALVATLDTYDFNFTKKQLKVQFKIQFKIQFEIQYKIQFKIQYKIQFKIQ